VKFRFMEQSREFAVGQLCRVLGVSRSGFYAWRRRPRSERDRQSTILVDRICAVHRESRGIYGSPRVYRALRSAGYAIGKHRVARLMQLEGLCKFSLSMCHGLAGVLVENAPSAS